MSLSRRLQAAAALLALLPLVQCQLTHDTDGLASVRPGGEGGSSAGAAGSGEGGQEAAGLSGASGQAGNPTAGQGGATGGQGGGGSGAAGQAGAPTCGGIGQTCCVPDGTTSTCKNLKAHCCVNVCADKGDYKADGVCKRCCARCPGANGARVFLDLKDGKSCKAEADVFCKNTAATADWIDQDVCE